MDEYKIPVIVGVGQQVNREKTSTQIDPLHMMAEVSQMAAKDASLSDLSKVDTLFIVNCLSNAQANPAQALSDILKIKPSKTGYTWIGATGPQWFVNQAAERIFSGKSELALICGGEAFYFQKDPNAATGTDLSSYGTEQDPSIYVGDLRDPLTDLEMSYGLVLPVSIYALYENALRAHWGKSIAEHIDELSGFCAGLSAIAAQNPYSWFTEPKTAKEISTVTEQNRMIVFPYTKLMCSIMNINQSAAIIMTSLAKAKLLGIPEDKIIFLRGYGEAEDVWYFSERPDLWASPSVKDVVDMALKPSNLMLDDIHYLDFYSCFPAPPRITREMLGMAHDDPRPLTITGGMPYFGGPGNNYSLHAICTMMDILRQNPEEYGLVQSLSWYIHKHVTGLYSAKPGEIPFKPLDPEQKMAKHYPKANVVAEANGKATAASYNITYNREGQAVDSIVIGTLENNDRFISRVRPEEGIYQQMTVEEPIGKSGKVIYDEATSMNWFSFK